MEEQDFKNLDAEEKAKIIMEHGRFVDCRDYINVRIILYSLSTLFVELFYNLKTNDFINISIANDNDLKKYLTNIDLDFSSL
jgi:hypothetical protein